MKAFLIDIEKCVGCHDCQIGCKDEHCGNRWMPYAESQPEIGQFWMKLDQQERGHRPHVKVTYRPHMCMHCQEAPCMKAAKDGAVYRREDGLVLIDPVKSVGQKQIVDACPYHAVYWNEEKNIPQKCTGCAHLLDDPNSPIRVPRCVDNCHVNVIQFGEESELDLTNTEVLHPEYGTKPRVFYRGLPKKFIAGTVYDPEIDEIIEGATVVAEGEAGKYETVTNSWGDFWLRGLADGVYNVTITAGDKAKTIEVDVTAEDRGLGDIAL